MLHTLEWLLASGQMFDANTVLGGLPASMPHVNTGPMGSSGFRDDATLTLPDHVGDDRAVFLHEAPGARDLAPDEERPARLVVLELHDAVDLGDAAPARGAAHVDVDVTLARPVGEDLLHVGVPQLQAVRALPGMVVGQRVGVREVDAVDVDAEAQRAQNLPAVHVDLARLATQAPMPDPATLRIPQRLQVVNHHYSSPFAPLGPAASVSLKSWPDRSWKTTTPSGFAKPGTMTEPQVFRSAY